MLVAFGELTPLAWGLLGMAGLFAAQLALCFKAQKRAVRYVPLGLLAAGFLCSAAVYAGVFGRASAGGISANELLGVIFAFITAVAAAGVLLAWLVYGVVCAVRRLRR